MNTPVENQHRRPTITDNRSKQLGIGDMEIKQRSNENIDIECEIVAE
jgi:hypothetical protein